MENAEIHSLITRAEIDKKVREVAEKIDRDYAGKELVLAVILKGGFVFAADLIRSLNVPLVLDFVGASSYIGTSSSGDIKITKDLDTPIEGKHLLLVEDIIDTGLTLHRLCMLFAQRNPKSIKVATLLLKNMDRKFDLPVFYAGFEVPNKFLVGYGLDYNEKHRGLPFVGYIEKEG